MSPKPADQFVAIACGGTGGHLFPGMAVGEKLLERGCEVALLVSNKEVDQLGARGATGMEIISTPAVPLLKGNLPKFLRTFWQSFLQTRRLFKTRKPAAVLAMGGFTSAAPIFAGRVVGARTAVHESNSIAGRANRLLAPWVNHVFIGFASAAHQLGNRSVQFTGTPVRSQFEPLDPAPCRMALGLDPDSPVLLVMGGSQGASAINKAVLEAVPLLQQQIPNIQFLHITGTGNFEGIGASYKAITNRARVFPFLREMEMALGAASVAISRAGASSLAEIAAMQLPSILVPYPTAADDHQYHNARAFAQPGAARMIVQSQLRSDHLASLVTEIVGDEFIARQMKDELLKWHYPSAADQIIKTLLREPDTTAKTEPHSVALRFRPG
ncbi:MAG TPA: undecaprenyldiphospho-muramoylpentapeptide beta-N-acetylglucosaminyltransferase [Candidatus Kapabacteria bacterium]|nr:undecaprenyldiphospho-muramoylpentapeptide beta-N-acetylglucosaminyltransferase [Candidatus Kapabacteria bacterium]